MAGDVFCFNTCAVENNDAPYHGRNRYARNDDNGHCCNYVLVLGGAALSSRLL